MRRFFQILLNRHTDWDSWLGHIYLLFTTCGVEIFSSSSTFYTSFFSSLIFAFDSFDIFHVHLFLLVCRCSDRQDNWITLNELQGSVDSIEVNYEQYWWNNL